MKKSILLIFMLSAIATNAQFFVTSGSTVDVSAGATLYSNEAIFNEGLINLRDASVLEFDNDLTNDGTIDYDAAGPTVPGILKIGSGNASTPSTSDQPQSLNFNVVDPLTPGSMPVDEEIPLIQLDKTAGTATIDRGHVRLTQRLLALQGTLDAQSSITGTSTTIELPNTDASRVVATGLTFISPDATTAAVVEESVGGSVENVIIERFKPQENRAYRIFTSSVTLNTTIKDNLQEGGQIDNDTSDPTLPLVDDPRPGYGTHITGATVDNSNFPNHFPNLADAIATGLDITNTGNPGMYSYDSASQTYVPVLDSDDATSGMTAGDPYLLFVRGDRSLDLTVNNSQIGPQTTMRMLGDLIIGPSTASNAVPAAGDFVLVGNPYQAQVDLNATFSNGGTNGINTSNVYVYDPKLGQHGAWVTVSLPSGSNTVDTSVSGTSPANQFLQPNQGIFVIATATSTNVAFEEDDKRSTDQNTTVDIYSDDSDVKFNVTLFNVDENSYNDNVLVKYGNYNDALDDFDAPKFWNQAENIAVENAGNFINLELRNVNGDLNAIKLNISNYSETNYQIQTNYINSQEFQNAYLIDHYLNTQTQLAEGHNFYDFSVDPNIPGSVDANRFEIGIDMTTLGTDNPDGIQALTLYPNPATTSVNLSLLGLADNIESVDVISVDGKLVKSIQVDNLTSYEMDISAMATGVYVVKATTANATYTEKLIIK